MYMYRMTLIHINNAQVTDTVIVIINIITNELWNVVVFLPLMPNAAASDWYQRYPVNKQCEQQTN